MRTQMNLMMGKTRFNDAVMKFDDLSIPLGWIENVSNKFIKYLTNLELIISFLINQILDDLGPTIELHLKLCLVILPIAMKVIAFLSEILGFYYLIKACFATASNSKSLKNQKDHEKESKSFLSQLWLVEKYMLLIIINPFLNDQLYFVTWYF